jgi:DHA1 family putative efflux transporter-like MFS transporter
MIMNRMALYVIALGVFLTGTSELVVSGILQLIANDLHISIAYAGQLITVYSLAFAIGTPIVTAFTSRLGLKKVLSGALTVFFLGSLLAFGSKTLLPLMVSRLILGISSGVFLVAAFGAAAKLVPAEKLGRAISTIVLGFSSAMILGVPIGIAITNWLNWQAIFLILAIVSMVITLVIIRLLPEIEGDVPVSFRQQFKVLGSFVIVIGLLLTFFRESGNAILFTYLTPFMTQILHVKAYNIGLIMLVLGIFGTIGSRLSGYGIDRWGASRILLGSLIVHIATLILLPIVGDNRMAGLSLIALMITALFIGGPAVQTYFIQRAPQSSNLVLSLNTSIIHLGLAAGSGAGGVLITTTSSVAYNPWAAGFVVALSLIAAIASFSMGGKRQRSEQITGSPNSYTKSTL